MKILDSNISQYLKKYYTYYVFIFIFGNAIIFTSIVTNIYDNIQIFNNIVTENIQEYEEVDLEPLCSLTNCDEIFTKKYSFVKHKHLEIMQNKNEFYHLFENIWLVDNDIAFYNKAAKVYFAKDYTLYIFRIIINLSTVFIFSFIILIYLMYNTYKKERLESMIINIGNEAILANKSMVMITENVHHELNTPVEVIENKIEKIHRVINKFKENQPVIDRRNHENRKINKRMMSIDKDFQFIQLSIEQILSVLAKMKNFKSLRFSNGDRTIYDVSDGAFKISSVSNTDFEYSVDTELKQYRMKPDNLKNVDLLNVLINHIKNSVEANATLIEIKKFKFDSGILEIVIIDNGSGIDNDIQKNVFTPNFSSKQIGASIRGNGMYLNKHIISEFGGNIKILESSHSGTSILISFPAIFKKYGA